MTDAPVVEDVIDLQARYRREMRVVGLRYIATNKPGHHQICEEVGSFYKGKPGQFQRIFNEIEKRCAFAAGFPQTFEEWLSTRSPESAPE